MIGLAIGFYFLEKTNQERVIISDYDHIRFLYRTGLRELINHILNLMEGKEAQYQIPEIQ